MNSAAFGLDNVNLKYFTVGVESVFGIEMLLSNTYPYNFKHRLSDWVLKWGLILASERH